MGEDLTLIGPCYRGSTIFASVCDSTIPSWSEAHGSPCFKLTAVSSGQPLSLTPMIVARNSHPLLGGLTNIYVVGRVNTCISAVHITSSRYKNDTQKDIIIIITTILIVTAIIIIINVTIIVRSIITSSIMAVIIVAWVLDCR